MARHDQFPEDAFSIVDLVAVISRHARLLVLGPVLVGMVAWGLSLLITPVYTSRAVIMPPQQSNNTALSTLQSLGALAGIAGGAPVRSTADQYVALMRSATMSDRILDAHQLPQAWGLSVRQDARDRLAANVHLTIGKKDGLITIEVDDTDPVRASAIANRYVAELRHMTNNLAETEAQQRREFFELHLKSANEKLEQAQRKLQSSGITEGALRAEPKAAAESYAALKAQVTAAEIRVQSLLRYATEMAPTVRQARAHLDALRAQLAKVESENAEASAGDYIANYREFKYQETLFDLFAKQFELAKLDESREAALIQVVDVATPPERKSKPVRLHIAGAAALASALALFAFVLGREAWRRSAAAHVKRVSVAAVP